MTRALRLCAALLAAALLSACGGSDQPQADPLVLDPTPTASGEPTPTPEVTATTPTATPTPTQSLPVQKPGKSGDVDGDGKPDKVTVADAPTGEGLWGVTLQLTTGGTRRGQVHGDVEQPQLVGIDDADGDGYGEVFLSVAQGSSTAFWGVLRLVGGVVREVTFDGGPLQLAVGGSVTHGDGFGCREEIAARPGVELITYSGDTDDGTTWHGTVTSYSWRGGAVGRVAQRTEEFAMGGSGENPRLRPYYEADCGALSASS